jgi:hypothetical protein
MQLYRNALPQLAGDLFLTDAGVETDLMFNHGIEIRDCAAVNSARNLMRAPHPSTTLDIERERTAHQLGPAGGFFRITRESLAPSRKSWGGCDRLERLPQS